MAGFPNFSIPTLHFDRALLHGVGFFSRAGELKAGETARLDFKASDMNDVLKSLTVEQKGGGKIAGLRYDSSESLDKSWTSSRLKLESISH